MNKKFWMVVLAVIFPVLAFAQVVDPNADLNGFLAQVLDAVKGGNWRLVAVLAAIGAIYALRRFGTKIPGKVGVFLATSRGGTILAVVFSLLVGLGSAFLAGQSFSLALLVDVLMFALTAIGGWVGVRRIMGIDGKTLGDAAAGKVVTVPGSISDVAKGLDPK